MSNEIRIKQTDVPTYFEAMSEPSGFPNRTDTTIEFSDSSPLRTFTISPAVSTFEYYIKGVRYTKSSPETVQIGPVEGLHYIFYDGSVLTSVANPTDATTDSIIRTKALVSILYWDNTNLTAIYVGDERHGIQMDGSTHSYNHFTRGLQYVSGLALGDFSIEGGAPAGDAAAQFSVALGSVSDEDIFFSISQILSTVGLPIFYRDGASGNWRKATQSGFSVLAFSGGDNRMAWNEFTGGAWQLSEVSSGDYALCHVFSSTEKDNPMIAVMGQAEYNNVNDARLGATTEINDLLLGDLASPELRPIATVIFQTNTSWTNNAVKSKVVLTDEGDNYVDWRTSEFSRGSAASSHGSLAGLDNDDHDQYMLLAGRTGGQTLNGSDTTAESLVLSNNSVDSDTFTIEGDGTLSTNVTSYETLVTSDNDIPNKKYVDDIVNAAIRLQGDWNANTNTPDITTTTTTGFAWRVSVAGSTDLGGITTWAVGDLAVKTDASWLKIANQDVAAVWGNITGTLSNQTDLQTALDGKQATLTNGVDGLTSAEVTQLANIDSTTISGGQWGYLGNLNQALTTTSAVNFSSVTTGILSATGALNIGSTTATQLTAGTTLSLGASNGFVSISPSGSNPAIIGNGILSLGISSSDPTITFDGAANDGKIIFKDDENYFDFDKGIVLSSGDLGLTGSRVNKGWLSALDVNGTITMGVAINQSGSNITLNSSNGLNLFESSVTGINMNATSGVIGIGANASAVIISGVGITINGNAGGISLNSNGANCDTVIEGDTDPNLFYADASTDRIGIGTNTPASLLDVDGKITALELELATGTSVNEIVTSVSGSSTDDQLASAKAVWDAVGGENLWNRVVGTPNYLIPNTAADDIGGTGARINKGWFTDIDSTNMIVGTGSGVITHNTLKRGATSESVNDDANIDLPDSTTGFGFVQAGDNEEYAQFSWTSAGVVTLLQNSANVVNTDTDGNLCIFDNGTTVRIRNRLGSTKTLRLEYNYS